MKLKLLLLCCCCYFINDMYAQKKQSNSNVIQKYIDYDYFCHDNGGFEDGNFGFLFHYGGKTAKYDYGECDNLTLTLVNGQEYALINPDFDPVNLEITNTILDPVVAQSGGSLSQVYSGSHAARINSKECSPMGRLSQLYKKFILPTSGTFNINFMYALVAEYPNHPNENPVFTARILKYVNNSPIVLDEFCLEANPTIVTNNFFNTINNYSDSSCSSYDTIIWSDWRCQSLTITGNTNEEFFLEIETTACGRNCHFGYSYVDDICMAECVNIQQGSIEMPEIESCTPMPFQYCVTYDPPYTGNPFSGNYSEGVLNDAKLIVLQSGGIINVITNYTHNASTKEVCFIITNAALQGGNPSISGYDFGVNLDFTLNGGVVVVTEEQIVPGQNNDYDTSIQALNSDFLLYNTTTSPIQLRATNFAAGSSGTIHEWYVLEEDQNGNLIPKIGKVASVSDVLLLSNLNPNSYYHVIHRVLSECGESCTVHTFYNDSSRLSARPAEIDCCAIYEYDWPTKGITFPTISGGTIDSGFTSSINSNGLINASATTNYSNNPNVEQTWVLYATPDISLPSPTLTQVNTATGNIYSYQVSNTSLDYYLVHTVKVNGCDIISCSAHELRNFAGRSVNGMMSNIDCTEICSTLDAPENLVRQVNNPNSVTIAWDPVPNALYYEILTQMRSHEPCCNSEVGIASITTTNTSYTINGFGYNASQCSMIYVRAICNNGTKSISSNSICIGKGTPYISPKPAGFDVIVYPNPTKDYFNLEFDSKENINVEVGVYNYQGVKINTKSTTLYENQKSKFNWSGDNLRPGLYFIIIESESETKKLKLVVE